MKTFDAPADLVPQARSAVIDLLYRMADDELIIGHRDSEWTGHGPILEADIAFSSMAQDEMGHALTYYRLLEELGEGDPDTLAFGRPAEAFRCCSLVALPNQDWAFSLVRQFLYDTAEHVRLTDLMTSAYLPLAQVARKLQSEEKYHLMHGRTWIMRLGAATADSRQRLQAALIAAWPHALGMFESTDAGESLRHYEICPAESKLCAQWQSAVAPVFREAGLRVPENIEPQFGGRRGRHAPELAELLGGMQMVYNIDPAAKW
jgi:ring-1,2-phenylacetyl-CoA epoxidase subunit PaaC